MPRWLTEFDSKLRRTSQLPRDTDLGTPNTVTTNINDDCNNTNDDCNNIAIVGSKGWTEKSSTHTTLSSFHPLLHPRTLGSSTMSRVISQAELAKHRDGDSIWIAIDGDVYDVSQFKAHPGGFSPLEDVAGGDVSKVVYYWTRVIFVLHLLIKWARRSC